MPALPPVYDRHVNHVGSYVSTYLEVSVFYVPAPKAVRELTWQEVFIVEARRIKARQDERVVMTAEAALAAWSVKEGHAPRVRKDVVNNW